MTADGIRRLEHEQFGYIDGTKSALFEIAAQLAELNETLKDIKKVADKPRLVAQYPPDLPDSYGGR